MKGSVLKEQERVFQISLPKVKAQYSDRLTKGTKRPVFASMFFDNSRANLTLCQSSFHCGLSVCVCGCVCPCVCLGSVSRKEKINIYHLWCGVLFHPFSLSLSLSSSATQDSSTFFFLSFFFLSALEFSHGPF